MEWVGGFGFDYALRVGVEVRKVEGSVGLAKGAWF